jgi:HlyD family secretion protein
MDIPRLKRPSNKRYIQGGIAVAAIILMTVVLANLKPAAPSVDAGTLWMDTVARGEMVREVRGPGTLVPEQIRWISALTPARVERVLAQPGDSVKPETVLLEMSNPDVQINALQAQQQLTAAEAALVQLRTNLETSRLSQEATAAQARTAYNEAVRNAMMAESLSAKGFGSSFELSRARDQAAEAATRLRIEDERLRLLTVSTAPQIRVQEENVVRLQAINEHRQNEVRGLRVKAGEAGVLQELTLQLGQWVVPGQVIAKVVQPLRLKAVIRVPETQAPDVRLGQTAFIDTRNGIVKGRVIRMDPNSQSGTVSVDIKLEGDLPPGARPDLSIDGTIELERLQDVLHVGRPGYGQPNSTIGMFKVIDGGDYAIQVSVQVGRSSVNTMEVIQGLNQGDIVILSDMTRWDSAERVRLK